MLQGVNTALGSITAVLGPLWAGVVYDRAGAEAPLWMGAIILALAGLLLVVRPVTGEPPASRFCCRAKRRQVGADREWYHGLHLILVEIHSVIPFPTVAFHMLRIS